jgi:DNA repair protein RecO (recombination protein O)
MLQLKTPALILRKRPRGERDVFISCYTPQYGKLEAVVAGAKKISSKLNAHCEPLSESHLLIVRGAKVWRIAGASLLSSSLGEVKDYRALLTAQWLAGITDLAVSPGQVDGRLYVLLRDGIFLLRQNNTPTKYYLVAAAYLLQLLTLLGYQTELYSCLACRQKLREEANYLSEEIGGLICPACQQNKNNFSRSLPAATLKLLRFLQKNSLATCYRLKINEALAAQVLDEAIFLARPHWPDKLPVLYF